MTKTLSHFDWEYGWTLRVLDRMPDIMVGGHGSYILNKESGWIALVNNRIIQPGLAHMIGLYS